MISLTRVLAIIQAIQVIADIEFRRQDPGLRPARPRVGHRDRRSMGVDPQVAAGPSWSSLVRSIAISRDDAARLRLGGSFGGQERCGVGAILALALARDCCGDVGAGTVSRRSHECSGPCLTDRRGPRLQRDFGLCRRIDRAIITRQNQGFDGSADNTRARQVSAERNAGRII